jgi:hypothetical protein
MTREQFLAIARPMLATHTWKQIAEAAGIKHAAARSRGYRYGLCTRPTGAARKYSDADVIALARQVQLCGVASVAAEVGRSPQAVLRLLQY